MVSLRLIVLDFDGCIVDSIPGMLRAHVECLRRQSVEVEEEEVLKCLGYKSPETFELLAAHNSRVAALWHDSTKRNLILREILELLATQPSPVFHIIPQLLQQIQKDKIPLALLTQRTLNSTLKAIDDNGLSNYFSKDMIITSDLSEMIKPKPSGDGLRYLMQKIEIKDSRTVAFIGDREIDRQTALDAGVFFLNAKWASHNYFEVMKEIVSLQTLLDCWALGLISTTSPYVAELDSLIKQNRLSIFLGAGFSLDAGFDDWNSLVSRFLGHEKSDIPVGSLPDLVQEYVRSNGFLGDIKIIDHLSRALSITPSSTYRHELLAALGVQRIWTTNYDTLIEDALGSHAQLITDDDELTVPGLRTQVIKLNGSIGSKFAKIVLSRQDFNKQIDRRREMIREFQAELCSRNILFIGTSFSDPLMDRILAEHCSTIDRRPAMPVHYTIQPKHSLAQIRSVKEYGITEIPVPDWQNVDSILAELKWRSRQRIVVVSGMSENSYIPTTQCKLLRILGRQLIESGFYIRTGGGPVVSSEIVDGAKVACDQISPDYHRHAIVRYSRILEVADILDEYERVTPIGKTRLHRLLLPVGMIVFVGGSKNPENYYDEMRREMFSNVDVCIAIGGPSENGVDPHSRGMKFEKALADRCGIPYIPLPFLPGYARKQYEEQKRTEFEVFNNSKLRELMSSLDAYREPVAAVRISVAAAIISCLA